MLTAILLPSFRKKRKLMIKVMILAGILGFLVSAVELYAAARLTNSPPANGNLVIGWDSRGVLEKADQISGPWTAIASAPNPYTIPITSGAKFFRLNQTVNATTLHKKVLCGYQGWFRCPGDGGSQWIHWSRSSSTITTNTLTFEMWPEMSEYTNKYPAPGFRYPGGAQAYLFSSQDRQTVDRHFDWMLDYGIDGVFVQRFVVGVASHPTNVLSHARSAANRTGRTFAITYDMSGQPTNTLLSNITNDWLYLVNTMHITNSTRSLYHKGKPVVAIWGFGFNDGNHLASPQQAQTVINWFKSQRVTVMGGVPTYWRTLQNDSYTNAAWTPVYLSFDVISPWAVGRFGNNAGADSYTASITIPDLAECKSNGIDYMPVVFPGFSWYNENGGPLNQIPRNGGSFYWRQVYDDVHAGCNMIYGAMFDEVNEGTAMYKLVPTAAQLPAQGKFLALDADGITLNSDWYLRLANQAGKMLRGQIPLQPIIPISPP